MNFRKLRTKKVLYHWPRVLSAMQFVDPISRCNFLEMYSLGIVWSVSDIVSAHIGTYHEKKSDIQNFNNCGKWTLSTIIKVLDIGDFSWYVLIWPETIFDADQTIPKILFLLSSINFQNKTTINKIAIKINSIFNLFMDQF